MSFYLLFIGGRIQRKAEQTFGCMLLILDWRDAENFRRIPIYSLQQQ